MREARCRRSSWRGRRRSRRASRSASSTSTTPRASALRYDRAGDRHYDLASAFIKSMRGSDPDAAVYYLAAMLEGGEDPRFLARRIVIAASEDVGNADPRALLVAVAAPRPSSTSGCPRRSSNSRRRRSTWRGHRSRTRPRRRSGRPGRRPARGHRRAARDAPRRALPRSDAPRPRRGYASPHGDPTRAGIDHLRGIARALVLSSVVQRRRGRGERAWRSRRVTGRRSSTSRRRATCPCPPRRLPRPVERPPRVPPLRVHGDLRGGGARSPGEPRVVLQRANTEIVFVSCDASAARQAWKSELGAEYTFASDFWAHGATAKRYGVFDETTGAPIRGTFLIDTDGVVIWSLVRDTSARRTEMVPESLETLGADHDRPWTAPGHSTALPVRSHRERDDAAPSDTKLAPEAARSWHEMVQRWHRYVTPGRLP